MGENDKPYTGPTVTHQAIETVPYRPNQPISRCWSKWTDGTITHSDSVTEWRDVRGYMMASYVYVNIGRDPHLRPPPGLRWVDTIKIGTGAS